MFKKLIAAVFVLSFLLALSTAAFAFKDPNNIRTLPNTLPTSLKPGAEFNVAAPDQPPQYSKPISAALQATNVSEAPYREPTVCDPFAYHDGIPFWYWPIPDDYGDDFFNMRFTPNPDEDCRLATVALCFYDAGSTVVSGDGIEIIVWADDGFGFPGAQLASIVVPAADMIWYPWYTVVDFTPFDLHFVNQEFHVGYTTVNQVDDVYAVLSDEGVAGTLRSSEFYLGMWGTMYNDWGLDVNFFIEADLCCTGGAVSLCSELGPYGTGVPYYYWTIPDVYGDDFFNERFTNVDANPGTLTTAWLGFYAAGSVDVTGEGVEIIVWDDDGMGYPGTQLGSVVVPTAAIDWYPALEEVDMRPLGLTFASGADFHIGYTTVNQGAGNVMACLSDDGSGDAEYRSSEFYGGMWGFMIDDWGVDVDFVFVAELCFGDPPADPICEYLDYNGDAYYFWTIPDAYGDDYFNMRFTHLEACTVKTLEIAFYAGGSVGSPGADFILFNSDGTYPTDTIAVYPVNPVTVWFPGYESVDVSADNLEITGDYHLGYTPIYNDPGDVLACLSDDGSAGTGRSSEWWGIWGTMLDDWGVDVNFVMRTFICCPAPPPPSCQEFDEWPTYQKDYARSGYNNAEVGDLCGFQRIWDYVSDTRCYFSTPTIAGEIVYCAFDNKVVALDIFSGAEVWNTATHPDYTLPTQIRSSPTVQDGVVYFSTGGYEGMVAADAFTGNLIWIRGFPGVILEGAAGTMRFCPTVVMGGEVFFGGDGGTMYALDAATGATNHFVPTEYGNSVWVSPAYGDGHLYFGCSLGVDGGDAGAGAGAGALYKYDMDLTLVSPFLGLLGWNEGCTSGATVSFETDEDGDPFTAVYANFLLGDHTGFDGYNQKADAATMAPLFSSYWLTGRHYYSTTALMPSQERLAYGNFAALDDRYSGLWVRSFENNTVWQDFTKGDVMMPPAISCDPYVFWTTIVPTAGFHCSDLTTGATLFSYSLSSYGLGTAISVNTGGVFVASTQLETMCGAGGGRLAMYSQGEDRPRLFFPSSVVTIDPPLDFMDPDGTERTAELFCNVGCAGLSYCLALDEYTPVRGFDFDPRRLARVNETVDNIVEYDVRDFNAMEGWKAAKMGDHYPDVEVLDRPTGKSFDMSTAAAPPAFVTLVSPSEGMLRVNDCYEGTFAFQVSAMNRGSNFFWVEVATDDPDYNECNLYGTAGCGFEINDYVLVDAVKGFAFCEGYLDFGDGGDDYEWVSNTARFNYTDAAGNSIVGDAFTVDGMDNPVYQGCFYWMVETERIAWDEESGEGYMHLFSDSACMLVENMYMDEMYYADGSSMSIYGDYFESAVIDSILNQTTGEFDDALTIGMRLTYREWGAFGAEFNNFKVIGYDLTNRNGDKVVEDVYFGVFSDLDMPGDGAGYEQVFGDIDMSVVYQFNEVSGEQMGFGFLPLKGSSLDGTLNLTTGMYNGYGISNPDEVYDPADLPATFFNSINDCPEGDWCFHPNAAPGAAPDDRGLIGTGFKHTFAGFESRSGAVVVFGSPTGLSGGQIDAMMKFANKWCGYFRGDCNNDDEINLNDLAYLAAYLCGGNAPYPFMHLGDVNADGVVDNDDAVYFADFFFNGGPMLLSALVR